MDYFNCQDWLHWNSSPATPPQAEALDIQVNDDFIFVENGLFDFASIDWEEGYPDLGAQKTRGTPAVNTAAGYEHYTPNSSVLTDTADSVVNLGYEPGPELYGYGSHGSSASSSGSPTSVSSFELCEEFNTDSLIILNDINSPTLIGPYDYDSPGPSDSTDTSPDTASGAWDSGSYPTLEGPRYLNYLVTPHDNAVNGPSNASLPHIFGTPSAAYDSLLSGALENFLYGEEELIVDLNTPEEQGPGSVGGQDASTAAIVAVNNTNIDNVSLQQIENEQSDWAVNSLHDEGIVTLTNKFDYDTGAGPSTGSSVAAAMLDIGHAPHSRRDDGAAVISAAPEEPKGKGKRKAMDAPELPPPSKKPCVAVEPPAMTDNFICSWPTPEFSTEPEGLNQRAATKFIHVTPQTASGGAQLLSVSGDDSAYGT